MRGSRFGVLLLAGLTVAAGAGASTSLLSPGRSLVQPGPVTNVAVTIRTVAFTAGVTPAECRVKLWNTASKALITFGTGGYTCREDSSTGSGIAAVSVARNRVAWLFYAGGNFRDWVLFTATPTKRMPRQLRFESRPVEDPAPIVLGPGTTEGIPYAVKNEITYLGESGAAIFTSSVPGAVRLIAAGPGPGVRRVVAALADGRVVTVGRSGVVVDTYTYPARSVKAVHLAGVGAVIQAGSSVEIRRGAATRTVSLPSGATMLDYRQGRIYYALGRQVHARSVATDADELLLALPAGISRTPLFSIDWGAAWAAGNRLHWRT
jgi:hypothetical protein